MCVCVCVKNWERTKRLRKQMDCRCKNCYVGCVRWRQTEKKMITEREMRDKWETSLSSDCTCLAPTVIVYVGSLNVLFLPGGNGQRERENDSTPPEGWVWLGKREDGKGDGWERKVLKNREGERERKKNSKKHIRTKRRRVVFKGLQFPASLCNVTEAALWLKWVWQLCCRQFTDIVTERDIAEEIWETKSKTMKLLTELEY